MCSSVGRLQFHSYLILTIFWLLTDNHSKTLITFSTCFWHVISRIRKKCVFLEFWTKDIKYVFSNTAVFHSPTSVSVTRRNGRYLRRSLYRRSRDPLRVGSNAEPGTQQCWPLDPLFHNYYSWNCRNSLVTSIAQHFLFSYLSVEVPLQDCGQRV